VRILPSGRNREATFDLTPMIDVVLLLIIFFSMTSQFSDTQNAPMDLPQERGQAFAPDEAAMSIVLDLDQDGVVSVQGASYSPDQLAALLAKQTKAGAMGTQPPLEVVVRADRRCMSAHLERLAQTIADAGILQWKIATTGKSLGER
jgi:biopolymer transport protein ExbD